LNLEEDLDVLFGKIVQKVHENSRFLKKEVDKDEIIAIYERTSKLELEEFLKLINKVYLDQINMMPINKKQEVT
jgi:hypothetical protein